MQSSRNAHLLGASLNLALSQNGFDDFPVQPLTNVFGQASQSQPYSPFQSLSPIPGQFGGPSGQVM